MHVVFAWIFYAAEAALHYWFLAGPIHLGAWILHSDSLVRMTPSIMDASQNITEMEFGLKHFAVNGTEDIRFSDSQEDDLFHRQKALGRVFTFVPTSVIGLVLLVPLLFVMYRAWCKKHGWGVRQAWVPLLRSYRRFIPLIAIATLMYLVSVFVMLQSPLCGPNYVELGYAIEQEDYYYYSRHHHHNHHHHHDDCDDGPDAFGTTYKIHSDISASCEVGSSAIGFAALTISWATLLLTIEWFLLNRRINKMEKFAAEKESAAMDNNKEGIQHGEVIDIEEGTPMKEEDDASTQPGSEKDLEIY